MQAAEPVCYIEINPGGGGGGGGGGADPGCADTDPVIVSESGLFIDGWGVSSVLSQDGAAGWRVGGFLFLRPGAQGNTAAILAIWYARPQELVGEWEAKAWTTSSGWKAINAIKIEHGISDCQDPRWVIDIPKPEEIGDAGSWAYSRGLLAADPLQEVVQGSRDRNVIVSSLEMLGYTAADIPFERACDENGCPGLKDDVLYALAAAIEAQQAVQGTGADGVGPSLAISFPCFPLSYTVPGPWGSWGATAWVFTGTTTTLGGTVICNYSRDVCRSRPVVEYTVTLACTVGVSNTWTENECWTETASSTSGPGGICPAGPAVLWPIGPPPPGEKVCRTRD